MNHLDTLYFGTGAMLLFKYPLQYRTIENLKQGLRDEALEDADNFTFKSEDEITIISQGKLYDVGITSDLKNTNCEDYTEIEIKRDIEMIDFDLAYEDVKRVEEQK